jgi:hypothetical protein
MSILGIQMPNQNNEVLDPLIDRHSVISRLQSRCDVELGP